MSESDDRRDEYLMPRRVRRIEEMLSGGEMTLRDWFAGQVLPGFVSGGIKSDPEYFASWAYAYADAMLAARGK